MPWRVVGVCAHAPKGLVDRSCTWRRTVGDFSHRLSFRGPYLASYHTTIERILIRHSTHAIALRSDPPLPRALRPLTPTERLLRTSGIVFWTH